MKRHIIAVFLLTVLLHELPAQQHSPLSVQQIMQDPARWIGTSPHSLQWAGNSQFIYFKWNPEQHPGDSLYQVNIKTGVISRAEEQGLGLPDRSPYFNIQRTKKLYLRGGDMYEEDQRSRKVQQLTHNLSGLGNIQYAANGEDVYFTLNNNLYLLQRSTGLLQQLTDFRKGKENPESTPSEQNRWLQQDQLRLSQVVRERKEKQEKTEAARNRSLPSRPLPIYTDNATVNGQTPSPDGRYITFRLTTNPQNGQTEVPTYVTESSYAEMLKARAKVGGKQATVRMGIYDTKLDTVYYLQTEKLPGLDRQPDFVKDYPGKSYTRSKEVVVHGPWFAPGGSKAALIEVRSQDNKDRWIALLELSSGQLSVLDHQRDEAWIGGPGMGWLWGASDMGWLPNGRQVWFQSEASGYSHLYLLDVTTGPKKQLTSGTFEVYEPRLSQDGKWWYFHSNQQHPGERHFYRMPVQGGKAEQLTRGEGRWDVTLSPDEKWMAQLYSTGNRPPELYLQQNKSGASPKKLTESLTEQWKAYPWRMPEYVSFTASDGAKVPARLYRPQRGSRGGPAVIFVHGAGYLQNAHKWWSSYFREYMFHNLLTDLGYTVLDIDYRGSAGYGRDWRTGIYRHMGGKDLSDHIDGARWLVEEHGIDSSRMGIYGGSYGGFITLMAMFNEPGTFAAGAALRSVTDWAHYNHPYTSNILNEPTADSLAYARSSPIYFAEGLQGHLLIAHGMIDTNVHFQDVVRLAQRLIELGKENWEMAVYPLEDHAFVEPSSWTDEYRRILKLFEDTIGDQRQSAD
ncbi:S9 family peptidase [Cesiribacter andamanensis]|uniref:Prolyl tripeptidyl peptidase n=1 Tax=Cesiribacter andamanensis AMV16 TaxID=1279009 RepID=M7NB71_9BACT|nr:S9 family peptidase [Cesiribacter andamanensis]EMR04451.1 Prolyl tripeptidyl peptidase precursor [Cesiribacter andamanensis AMV16]